MPREPAFTEIRLSNIITCLTPVIPLLNELNDTCGAPFVQTISNTTLSLITGIQQVKRNKNECIQLTENIHALLYAIVKLHIKSETGGSLPPATLYQLAKFTETLHKIHMFVEMQDNGNKIKHFFRQNEISTLLKDCRDGLHQALDFFKVKRFTIHQMESTIFNSIGEMNKAVETMHKELLEMISTLSDGTIFDRTSSIYQCPNGSQNSSKSFSMLPSKPKIFHGRESELEEVVKMLNEDSPRIAILGAGGMGKTSLARAALHHSDVAIKYEHRFFVVCDSATNSIGVAAVLGAHLGLKPGKDLKKPVLQNLTQRPSSLLILDNLETPWEPKESRDGVEEFLSLLTDIKHLALVITMRGAERPAKTRWTRPFLPPLKHLTNDAAWQTFVDIADDFHNPEDIHHLLGLANNMPLAVDLIAHLVDAEGCSNVLSRWEAEKTSLLSAGHDRRSSLDASIALSLSGSRMKSSPGAKDLLTLLSILPDGLSDVELMQSNFPIRDILQCKGTLLGTSLAYIDDNKRLKCLVPIREHVLQFHPPSAHVIEPLKKHFHQLLKLYQTYYGTMQMASKMNQITLNFGNLQKILQRGLHPGSPHLSDTIECTMALNSFSRLLGHGWLDLMDVIPSIFPQPCNHRLEAEFIIERFISHTVHPISTPEPLVNASISHFNHFNDLILESKFYMVAGSYYHYSEKDPSKALLFLGKALTLARESENTSQQANILRTVADIKWMHGDYFASRADAHEAQRLAQLSANWYHESLGLWIESKCWSDLGDNKKSIMLLTRGQELLMLCGLSGGVFNARIMATVAQIHFIKSEYDQARRIYILILQNPSAEQNVLNVAISLLSIAEIDVMIGACKHDVHQNLNKAKTIFKTIHRPLEILLCEVVSADLHLGDRNLVGAKSLVQECLKSFWGKSMQFMFYCLERLADTSRWKATDFGWSSLWTMIYLVQATSAHAKLDLHKALQFLGDVFLHNGDEETAHSLFIVALEGFTYMDVHRSRANCMLRLGDLAQRRGQTFEAVELWRSARPLFELASQTKDVAQIDARLGAADQANEKALAQLTTLNAPTELWKTLSIVAEEADQGKPAEEDRKQDMCRNPL
ncbi:hypothetical protein FB451DRAFT_1360351 [Mycena latifolia]|nr:hypothetical protein FB451DRAFT_1360351 [Mycena latifolia]